MSATLNVDLAALRANYRLLTARHAKGHCAAVVKADAYGLGVGAVSQVLYAEGCREFFVATLEEAIELRGYVSNASIAVFSGPMKGEDKDYAHYWLTPVLGTLEQVERVTTSEAILHIDTGMTRLGLSQTEVLSCQLPAASCRMLMSHLACANDPAHPKNAEQLHRFKQALAYFPGARASLANSAGIFLGHEFHFDVARPGCALYGINPIDGENPMRHVATLSAPILQIRTLDRDETVGYGATYAAKKGSRIAIAGLGYADGFLRHLGGKASGYIGGRAAPIVGRVSMDMIALDVSALPENIFSESARVELINEAQDVNAIAKAAGTIGYEIFTRIGQRVKRLYS